MDKSGDFIVAYVHKQAARGMKMRIALALLLAFGLSSCAQLDIARSAISTQGANAADQALNDSIWIICNATPVGAIKRRFKTLEEINGYNALCNDSLPVTGQEE